MHGESQNELVRSARQTKIRECVTRVFIMYVVSVSPKRQRTGNTVTSVEFAQQSLSEWCYRCSRIAFSTTVREGGNEVQHYIFGRIWSTTLRWVLATTFWSRKNRALKNDRTPLRRSRCSQPLYGTATLHRIDTQLQHIRVDARNLGFPGHPSRKLRVVTDNGRANVEPLPPFVGSLYTDK